MKVLKKKFENFNDLAEHVDLLVDPRDVISICPFDNGAYVCYYLFYWDTHE